MQCECTALYHIRQTKRDRHDEIRNARYKELKDRRGGWSQVGGVWMRIQRSVPVDFEFCDARTACQDVSLQLQKGKVWSRLE